MRTRNLAEQYGLPLVDWGRITERLAAGVPMAPGSGGPNRHTCWLTTVNEDGSPHVTGVGALWVDGAFWFETGDGTRKGRNVARDPRCVVSLTTDEFDLVVEGTAHKVTDPTTVQKMAARWAEAGWPCSVDESGTALTAPYSAPSAGPPPWSVYRVDASGAIALAVDDPAGATRFLFDTP